ncbi:hypothetical protein [Brachybacterium sp. FME24]|uniref:hypothetical protein n=1 Tax=Brachybacterium sp. FME24 TaxID=2742605 RepID=UPI0018673BCC|nr:hypothetical protein [Brachybacterium sp. FME24]
MKPIATIRDRIAEVPAAVRRRTDSSTTHSRILADARAVAPGIPRTADSGHLVRAARRLVRRAAQDEFAREGVTQVRLPDERGRTELRRADVPGGASFHAFVEDVLSALEIAPSVLERDDAIDLRNAPSSADRYGLSPEVASDLASYLLGKAFELDDEAHDVQEFFASQASRVREDVRATLVRQVKVPLELKVALDRHERIESGLPPVADGFESPTVEDFASPTGGPGDEDATEAERQSFAARAQAAYNFAQSEAGRAAFGMLRTGAEKAYERYGQREGEVKPPKPGSKSAPKR